MKVKNLLGIVTACTLGFAAQGWAAENATPEEIIAKTQEAAAALSEKGEAGLAAFSSKDGGWVWKDTYVFVMDCGNNTMAAHPIKPSLAGKSLSEIKDTKDNDFFADLCTAAAESDGGWVEYWWSKPDAEGDFRKISYAIQAGDSAYQVGAGVYDDSLTVEELDAMLAE